MQKKSTRNSGGPFLSGSRNLWLQSNRIVANLRAFPALSAGPGFVLRIRPVSRPRFSQSFPIQFSGTAFVRRPRSSQSSPAQSAGPGFVLRIPFVCRPRPSSESLLSAGPASSESFCLPAPVQFSESPLSVGPASSPNPLCPSAPARFSGPGGVICGAPWPRCTPWRGAPSSAAPWESVSPWSCRCRMFCSRCAQEPFRGCG